MDQTHARALFEHGAVIIFQNAAKDMEFGIDTNLWTVGPKFMGMKMVPPGVHLISLSIGNLSKHSFFHKFKHKEVFVVSWNAQDEKLSIVSDQDAIERFRINLCHIDPMLAPYPYDYHRKWLNLSDKITEYSLDTIFTHSRLFYPFSSSNYPDDTGMTDDDNYALKFSVFNIRRSYPNDCDGSTRTNYIVDKSWLLTHVLQSQFQGNWSLMLSELQISFLVLLYGHNFEGFEQWKRLIHLISHSMKALESDELEQFYVEFISVLSCQVQEISSDIFQNVLKHENFLAKSLVCMAQSMHFRSLSVREEVKSRWIKFEKFVLKHLQWDLLDMAHDEERRLDAEEGEDAPQIVEL